jgi:hypothetical protein
MASINEYAQLSAAVYAKTAENRIVPPADWVEVDRYQDHPVTGFAAGVFRHRATGEIVIAYAGSQDARDWVFGNLPAAAGEYAPQVRAAMELYVRARQRYGDNISFTGHSLGGGFGFDSDEFTGAFGHDTLIDADGAGAIRIDGQALPAGLRAASAAPPRQVVDGRCEVKVPCMSTARSCRTAVRCKARGLEQLAEAFERQTRVLDDAAHRDGIDRIVARDRQDPLAVAHHDVLALTHDPEAGFLQRPHRVQMVDAGKPGQG